MECSDYNVWKAVMQEELSAASSFDIHCWNEEKQSIQLALKFGAKKPFDWSLGPVISGTVTPELIYWMMEIPKPEDEELFKKMMPFFSIFMDTRFFSEHYGTERIKR